MIIKKLEGDVEEFAESLVRVGQLVQRGMAKEKSEYPFKPIPMINKETGERAIGFMMTVEDYRALYRAVSNVFMAQRHRGKS